MSYRSGRTRKSGREYAQAHIQAGIEFSDQVGEADVLVKDAFFSLNGKARAYLLDKYEELYGKAKRDYAQETIPKWKSGERKMSGDIAKRLFDLMPPLMPTDLKHQVVEKIWKRYGPHSKKYVYVGHDADRVGVMHEVQKYFSSLNVLHAIPSNLERRFDWISDNDVTVKQQLLNYFMDEQRQLAIASSRLSLGMILDQMNAPNAGQVSKLSHAAMVGNHQLEIIADPLRTGFIFSDSDREMTRRKIKFSWPSWLVVAGVVVGIYGFLSQSHGTPSAPPPAAVQQVVQPAQAEQQAPVQQEQSSTNSNPPPGFVPDPTPAPKHAQAVLPPVPLSQRVNTQAHVVSLPPVFQPQVEREAASQPQTQQVSNTAPDVGCANVSIASVEDEGATIRLSNGSAYTVSIAGVMRYAAGQWSTGDAVTVCNAAASGGVTFASISNPAQYSKVQATLAASGTASQVSCSDVRIARVSDEGATIDTTDGGSYRVSTAGVMRYAAGQWSTGDAVTVCRTTLAGGGVAAAINNAAHYSKIQATALGRSSATTVKCKSTTITSVKDEGSTISIAGGASYAVSSVGVMRYAAGQWSTGDSVNVCEVSGSDGSISASIENPEHYAKVQATRS